MVRALPAGAGTCLPSPHAPAHLRQLLAVLSLWSQPHQQHPDVQAERRVHLLKLTGDAHSCAAWREGAAQKQEVSVSEAMCYDPRV